MDERKKLFRYLEENDEKKTYCSIPTRMARYLKKKELFSEKAREERKYQRGLIKLPNKIRWEKRVSSITKEVTKGGDKGKKIEVERHELFRHEFLATVPYRFAELFWNASVKDRRNFFEVLENDPFFTKLANKLPKSYFEKGWKRKNKDIPKDNTELAEIKRIFDLIITVDMWGWKLNKYEYVKKNPTRLNLTSYLHLSTHEDHIQESLETRMKMDFSIPVISDSREQIDDCKEKITDENNFLFVEDICSKSWGKYSWPNKVVDLQELFFFFEKIFEWGAL